MAKTSEKTLVKIFTYCKVFFHKLVTTQKEYNNFTLDKYHTQKCQVIKANITDKPTLGASYHNTLERTQHRFHDTSAKNIYLESNCSEMSDKPILRNILNSIIFS